MSDNQTGSVQQNPEYPSPSSLTIFADSVSNAAYGPQIVKFFLTRSDPSINVTNSPFKIQAFAQVVMPLEGFLGTSAFFETIVNSKSRNG